MSTAAVRHQLHTGPLAHLRRSDPQLREIVLRVRQWGLTRGIGATSDALTAVVGVALEEARLGLASPTEWPEDRVDDVTVNAVPALCASLGCAPPQDLADGTALWLAYLTELGVLKQPEPKRLRAVAPWSRHPAGKRGA